MRGEGGESHMEANRQAGLLDNLETRNQPPTTTTTNQPSSRSAGPMRALS